MNALRFFWLALFVFFIGIASYMAEELFFPLRPSVPQGSIEWAIHQDLKRLKEENKIPLEIEKIHQVFVVDRRQKPTVMNLPEITKFHFPQKAKGLYDLQIEIFDTDPDKDSKESPGLIFQFSLFEKNSKNKIWELSRTYP